MEPKHSLLGLVQSVERLLPAQLEDIPSSINSGLEEAIVELVKKLEAFQAKDTASPPFKYLKSDDEPVEGAFEVLGVELWKLLKKLEKHKVEETPAIKRLESIYRELFPVALLPDDVTVDILSLLPYVRPIGRPQSNLKPVIAVSQRYGHLSQLAAIKVILDSKVELKRLGFMSARDAVQFAINHHLQVVNLNGFDDLTMADLNYLATSIPHLKELMFDNFQVKLLPTGLLTLTNLEISMDNVTGNGIEHCKQMRSVQNLTIKQGSNKWLTLTDSFVEELVKNPNLHSLKLPSVRGFSAAGLENLGKCKQLKSLELNVAAGFADALDSPWAFLGELESLERLILYDVREVGQALIQIQKLSKLSYLHFIGQGALDEHTFEKIHLPPALLTARLINLKGLKNAGVLNFERCGQIEELELDVTGDFESSVSLPWDFLGKLRKLKNFRLYNVQESEQALKQVQQLPLLKHLYLLGLETAESQNFENLNLPESLVTLSLFKLNGSNRADLFRQCNHLEILELDDDLGSSWDFLGRLNNLQSLRLVAVKELKQVLVQIQKLPKLNYLYIETKGVAKQELKELPSPASLLALSLSNLRMLENPGLKEIADGKKLRQVTFNFIEGLTDEVFATLSNLDNLEVLNLIGCPGIEGKSLDLLKNLKRLESLTLSDLGDFTLEGIHAIGSLERLRLLELSDLPFIEADLGEIQTLQKLERLSLSGSVLLLRGTLKNLASCQALETLNMDYCDQFFEEDLKNLLDYPSLKRVYVKNVSGLTQDLENALRAKGIDVFR